MKKLLHPYLLAIYPVLFLYSKNIDFFPLGVIATPVLAASLLAFILLNTLTFLLRNESKAGVLTSLFMFSFLSYGHYSRLSEGNLYQDALNLLLWSILLALFIWVVVFLVKDASRLTKPLNIASLFLIALPIVNIGVYSLTNKVSVKTDGGDLATGQSVLGARKTLPDIYYIILDGYGRSDVLNEMYNYDNSELIEYLTDKGFYVAAKSTTNYNSTSLSLASSLNLNYIDELISGADSNTRDKKPLNELMRRNEVASTLRKNGYRFVVISSGYYGSDIKDANLFLAAENSLGEFENAVVSLTPVPAFLSIFSLKNDFTVASVHRRTVLNAFDKLSDTSIPQKPAFIFAHIIAPHSPFVFGENGEGVPRNQSLKGWDGSLLVGVGGFTKEDYLKYYRDQAAFVSKKVKATIENILSNSEQPPVIILQSDHGPGSGLDWKSLENTNLKERFSILNAYYFPDKDYNILYESITPVNTFRIIFNKYFGSELELLPNENFFSTYSEPYKFSEVTDVIERGAR